MMDTMTSDSEEKQARLRLEAATEERLNAPRRHARDQMHAQSLDETETPDAR